MSWSISAYGTKEEVKAKVIATAKSEAARYGPEEADIGAAQARIMVLLEALAPTEEFPTVSVSAHGSHSTQNGALFSASMSVSVSLGGKAA
jgi:hypothetical protein